MGQGPAGEPAAGLAWLLLPCLLAHLAASLHCSSPPLQYTAGDTLATSLPTWQPSSQPPTWLIFLLTMCLPPTCPASLQTLERMQQAGFRPDACVYNCVLDGLWSTGVAAAQSKAVQLFQYACRQGHLRLHANSSREFTAVGHTYCAALLFLLKWLGDCRWVMWVVGGVDGGCGPLPACSLAWWSLVLERFGAEGKGSLVKSRLVCSLKPIWQGLFSDAVTPAHCYPCSLLLSSLCLTLPHPFCCAQGPAAHAEPHQRCAAHAVAAPHQGQALPLRPELPAHPSLATADGARFLHTRGHPAQRAGACVSSALALGHLTNSNLIVAAGKGSSLLPPPSSACWLHLPA